MRVQRLSRWVALAALVWTVRTVAGAEPLTVTAPADGTVLRGGSLATISWTPAGALPRDVVEWEAFLSVDGGRYYATRITPHLDIDIRTFEWRVPNVTSNDVRLLIRIGDEREERSVDVPLRLSIVADPGVRPPPARVGRSRGESARPGDPAVAEWATGDRGGRHVGLEREPAPAELRAGSRAERRRRHAHAETHAGITPHPALHRSAAAAAAPRCRASSPLLARDILLLVRRRNI